MDGIFFKGIRLTTVFLALLFGLNAGAQVRPQVIYGPDNRKDLYQVQDAGVLAIADSTLAMIPNYRLYDTGKGTINIRTKNYATENGLCEDEAFSEQPVAADCSGFLVGPRWVATAGHCVTAKECKEHSFVFGFGVKVAGSPTTSVDENEVYKCQRVVTRTMNNTVDFALVELDRDVEGHTPLRLAHQMAEPGDEVLVIGHPSGLPTKVSDGAQVREQKGSFFVSNLDTYGGNSGSAVLNARTLEVVGILVRGDEDFKFDQGASCARSKICRGDSCRGEDVTNISFIQKSLAKIR